jgi:putative ABC transport system permease protein
MAMPSYYWPKDLMIRTAGDPAALTPAVRDIIRAADPEQAISDVQPLEDMMAIQTAPRRAQLRILGTFAGVAFLLAAVGIYGLLSFAVTSRTREVGVRMALGAQRRNVLVMFLRQGIVLGIAGVAVAMPLAYVAARAMSSLLFGVQPGDPPVYVLAAALAIAMTIAGSLRPAFRAARVDPAITIRTE